jgi:hypothetical protein
MKKPIDQSKESNVLQQNGCDEKKCATCFQNRGCIYDHYITAASQSMEKFYIANQKNINQTTIAKR